MLSTSFMGAGQGGGEPESQKCGKVSSKHLAPPGIISYICLFDCVSPSGMAALGMSGTSSVLFTAVFQCLEMSLVQTICSDMFVE